MTRRSPHLQERVDAWARTWVTLAETHFVSGLGVVLLIGVFLRLILIATTTTASDPMNRFYPGYTDGWEYMDNARSLVETGVYGYAGRPSAFRPPAYPFLLALTWWTSGQTLTPIRLIQVGFYVLMTVVYARVVAARAGRAAGLGTSVIFALYPMFVFMTAEISTESLYMAISALVFALTLSLLEPRRSFRRRLGDAFMAGLFCGLGILTRPNMLVVLIPVAALIGWDGIRKRGERGAWLAPVFALLVGTWVVLTPWLVRNDRQFGSPVVSTNIQYNVFRGTFDLVDRIAMGGNMIEIFRTHGVLYEEEIEDVRITRLPLDEITSERNASIAARSIIQADPVGWLWQRGRNGLYLWLNLQWDATVLQGRTLVKAASAAVTLGYYLLLLGAVVGSLVLWRNRREASATPFLMVSGLFILAAMSTVLTFVGKRYRVAMIDPYLTLLVGAGVGWWLRQRWERAMSRVLGSEAGPLRDLR
jgi:4-amino-4-deoxy-L-arabinose transferase-like glycosyltransferase